MMALPKPTTDTRIVKPKESAPFFADTFTFYLSRNVQIDVSTYALGGEDGDMWVALQACISHYYPDPEAPLMWKAAVTPTFNVGGRF